MSLRRALRFEPLEDRRLLAVVTVSTLDDTVDFNDGVTSLREAIFATNLVGGADTIEFAAALTSGGPATLTLTRRQWRRPLCIRFGVCHSSQHRHSQRGDTRFMG